MQGQLATTSERLATVLSERDNLRRAYRQLMEQFELLRRRIFVAKAERVDTAQLEIDFAATKQKLDAIVHQLGDEAAADIVVAGAAQTPSQKSRAGAPLASQLKRIRVRRRRAAETSPRQSICPSAASRFATPSLRTERLNSSAGS